jgi:hypothetical protein
LPENLPLRREPGIATLDYDAVLTTVHLNKIEEFADILMK